MGMLPTIIFALIIFLLAYWLISNSLIAKKNSYKMAFASIDAQLKRRYDLIPNLVDVAKRFMEHEIELFSRITELRTKGLSSTSTQAEQFKVSNELQNTLHQILINAENYPNLKSDQQFLAVQSALRNVEEEISAARRAFNAAVTEYNNAIEMFPSNLVATLMHLKTEQLFEATATEREPPRIKELFKH